MTTATKQAVFKDTAHAQMRENARVRFEQRQEVLQKHQDAMANIQIDIERHQGFLADNQTKRTALLASLDAAQEVAYLAREARELAEGTPVYQEQQAGEEKAQEAVQSVRMELLGLSGEDERVQTGLTELTQAMEKANESLAVLQRTTDAAQGIYQDVDGKHRDELKEQALAALQAARQHRAELAEQMEQAEDACRQAQARLGKTLSEWPEFAMNVLTEHGELPPDVGTAFLEEKLRYNHWMEEQAMIVAGDVGLRGFMQVMPDLSYFANNVTRREQKRFGRVHLSLQQYDIDMEKLEQELERRRTASRIEAAGRAINEHQQTGT